jgi:hypothetical protein
VITSKCEQYGNTVHLFIGTGRSPDKITFVSLITNYNHNTNYQGLCSLFLFKSVPSSVLGMPLCRSSLNCSFGIYLHVVPACISSCRRCFFLRGPSAEKKAPNNVHVPILLLLIIVHDKIIMLIGTRRTTRENSATTRVVWDALG